MLTRDEVDFFCAVGRGTPVGEVFRRYWTPALPASDLPRPGCPPVRLTLLGEQLVAFRDRAGRVGILDEFCCHRGSSLSIGRVEECGLRCIYHGWLFDTDGRIVETPNMPADSRFKDLNRQLSYPAREAGGLIWTYMGPSQDQPPFPEYYWFGTPAEQVYVNETVMDCNWLQVFEGAIDSSHVGVLHHGMHSEPSLPDDRVADMAGVVRFGGWRGEHPVDGSPTDNVPTDDMAPRFDVETTDFGFQYAAIRDSVYGPDRKYVRVTAVVFPAIAYIPPSSTAVIEVPVDDVTTAQIGIVVTDADPDGLLNQSRIRQGGYPALPPSRSERRVPLPPQDRVAMEQGRSFTGWAGIQMQDRAVQQSMGRRSDRHNEHPVAPADAAIVRYRHLLRQEAERVAAGGRGRFADSGAEAAHVRSGSGIVPEGADWHELVAGNLGRSLSSV